MESLTAFMLHVLVIATAIFTTGVTINLNASNDQYTFEIIYQVMLNQDALLARQIVETELSLLERYQQMNPSVEAFFAINTTRTSFKMKCHRRKYNATSAILRIRVLSMPDQIALVKNGAKYLIIGQGCSLKLQLTGNGETENDTAKLVWNVTFDFSIALTGKNNKLKVKATRGNKVLPSLPNLKLTPRGTCDFTKFATVTLFKLTKRNFVGHLVEIIEGTLGRDPVSSQQPQRQPVGRALRNLWISDM